MYGFLLKQAPEEKLGVLALTCVVHLLTPLMLFVFNTICGVEKKVHTLSFLKK